MLCASPRGGQAVTLSFGVSASRYGDIFDYDQIFEQADAALYRAKNSGRNQVCVADEIDLPRPAASRVSRATSRF